MLIIINIIFAVLTFVILLLHSRRIVFLFNWVLDYLQAVKSGKEKDCPKCNKSVLEHTLMEARNHGIIDKFNREMKKQVIPEG